MGRKQSPEHVAKRVASSAATKARRREPPKAAFDRDGATSLEVRPKKVAVGVAAAAIVRQTGRPHKLISDRGLERLLHDLRLAEDVPEHDLHKAVVCGTPTGDRRPPTKRSVEIMQMYARGLSTKEIAAELGITQNAVVRSAERCFWSLGVPGGQGARAVAIGMLVEARLVRGRPMPKYNDGSRRQRTPAKKLEGRRAAPIDESAPRVVGAPSVRELDALDCLAGGLNQEEGAVALRITDAAFKSRLKAVKAKLGAKTVIEAVAIAVRRGLLDPV